MPKSLKEQNQTKLWIFYSLNIVLFISVFFLKDFTYNNLENLFKQFVKDKGWLILISPIVVPIINGILNSNIKASIVFLKVKEALPGNRAFSKLARNDPRINFEKLKLKLGEIPNEPKKQNTLWYSLYKKHSEKITVIHAQKYFLLIRDIASFSLLILLLSIIVQFFLRTPFNSILLYIVYLVFQFFITSHVARVYGKKFVCNVLAEESV